MNKEFIIELKKALQDELPGNRAHQEMISYSRPSADIVKELDIKPRESAVLILLYQENDEWNFPLIKRQEYNGVHSKQIGLPGGKFEKGDLNLQNTSLREANEEIGVNPDHIEILGHLSEIYIPPSNFLVKPYIGYLQYYEEFVADEVEVNRIIKTPVKQLLELPIEKRKKYVKNGKFSAQVSSFIIEQEVVWGATAMMLNEFRVLLREKVI